MQLCGVIYIYIAHTWSLHAGGPVLLAHVVTDTEPVLMMGWFLAATCWVKFCG